jgi:hypothetical protein
LAGDDDPHGGVLNGAPTDAPADARGQIHCTA